MATLKRFRNVVVDPTEVVGVNPAGVIKYREGGTIQVTKDDAAALIRGLTTDDSELAPQNPGKTVVQHGIPTLPTQPAPEAIPVSKPELDPVKPALTPPPAA